MRCSTTQKQMTELLRRLQGHLSSIDEQFEAGGEGMEQRSRRGEREEKERNRRSSRSRRGAVMTE